MVRGNITTWLGRAEHPVLAHLHHPAADVADTGSTTGLDAELVADVAGAIVLCPPLGREQVASYRTMRQLGDALAARGWLVVRLNWSGQSDSSPMDAELSLLENWQADLAAVVEQVRGAGVPQVHLAGHILTELSRKGGSSWVEELVMKVMRQRQRRVRIRAASDCALPVSHWAKRFTFYFILITALGGGYHYSALWTGRGLEQLSNMFRVTQLVNCRGSF